MLRPMNKRLVAKLVEEAQEKTINGIILTAKEPKKDTYTVISVAENEQGIRVGDRILIEKYDALQKEFDGETVYIIQCERVLGVIE